jgi:predicted AAA+ superfamily ATPase
VLILTGVRRCGKSTLLQELRRKNKKSDYYLNFDDDRLANFKLSDFQMLYELFIEQFGVQNDFYFDEIQNIPGWERFVRRLHDQGKKVTITGSNASLLSRELGTHLTGRYWAIELYPFSFQEYLLFKKQNRLLDEINKTENKALLKKSFKEYFTLGGFPEYLKEQSPAYLQNLYESILYRDIMVRHKLTGEKIIKELLTSIASNVGKLISFNKIKKQLGLGSATTVKDYFQYFENSYLAFTVSQFKFSITKQILAPKKVYMIDLGLARILGFRFSQDQGHMLEMLVFLELKRHGQEMYYHQNQKECDFLIKKGSKITQAIQVSWSLRDPQTKAREVAGLVEALQEHKLKTGLILTEDEFSEEIVKTPQGKLKIQIMPVWRWLLSKEKTKPSPHPF